MKRKLVSHSLKALMVCMAIFSLFTSFYVLPRLASDLVEELPSISYAKDVLLPLSQALLLLFILGLALILVLLFLFDKGKVYSHAFMKILSILAILCLVGALGLLAIFIYTISFGGPGPLLTVLFCGALLLIFVIMMTILLIRFVIEDALTYKDELDLVV